MSLPPPPFSPPRRRPPPPPPPSRPPKDKELPPPPPAGALSTATTTQTAALTVPVVHVGPLHQSFNSLSTSESAPSSLHSSTANLLGGGSSGGGGGGGSTGPTRTGFSFSVNTSSSPTPPPLPARPSSSALHSTSTSNSTSTTLQQQQPLSPGTNSSTTNQPKLPPRHAHTAAHAAPFTVAQSPHLSRAPPFPLSAVTHELSHKGNIRCFASNGLLAVTVGEKNLRVTSLDLDVPRELAVLPIAALSSNSSSNSLGVNLKENFMVTTLDRMSTSTLHRDSSFALPVDGGVASTTAINGSGGSSGGGGSSSDSKATALAFVPSTRIDETASTIWLALDKIGELIHLSLLPQITLLDRKQVHSSTVTHILPVSSTELWSLDDQGGLRVWQDEHYLSLTNSLSRSLRIHAKTSVAHVVLQKYLWTTSGKSLEINEPNSTGESIFRVRHDVTGTAGTFLSLAGGGVEGGPVYSGHEDGKVIVWEPTAFTKRYVVTMGLYKVVSLCVVEKGRLWVGWSQGKIGVFDTSVWDRWLLVKEFMAHGSSAVGNLVVDVKSVLTRGELFVVSCANEMGNIKVWDGFLVKDWKDSAVRNQEDQFATYRDVPVFVATWNINACKPEALESLPASQQILHQWFSQFNSSQPPPSIISINFQELVDLESKKANAKQLFMEVTGTKSSSSDNRLGYWREKLSRTLQECLPHLQYRLIDCHQLFGLFQCTFLLESEISNLIQGSISLAQVKTGLGGLHGNKGGIATRFLLNDTSLCFLNCHLAAHQSHVSARNNDLTAIRDGTTFPYFDIDTDAVFTQGGDGTLSLDHNHIFFAGDLNYRIDLPRETVLQAIDHREYTLLLQHDQLSLQFAQNAYFALKGFIEPPITFAPTFKYDVGSTRYDSSEKRRVPAWCDRVLYKGSGRFLEYTRGECVMSDHRPVSAMVVVRIKKIDYKRLEGVRLLVEDAGISFMQGRAREWGVGRGLIA